MIELELTTVIKSMYLSRFFASSNQFFWATPQRPYLLLFLLGAIIWASSIHTGYVHLDTQWLVVNNPLLSTGSLSVVPPIWSDLTLGTRLTLGAEYLPVRDMSVLLDFAIFSDKWQFHHLNNLLLYLASCLLLLKIFFILLGHNWKAWVAVLLFTVHPTHIESVSWLASRKDVLSLFLFLAALLLYLSHKRGLFWATVLGLLAYWSKNTAIALPPLLVICSLLHKKQSIRTPSWWLQWVPIGILFLMGLLITMKVGGLVSMLAERRADTFWGNLTITAQAWWQYLQMLVLPLDLAVFYVEPTKGTNLSTWGGLACILATMVGAWRLRTTRPVASIGLVWIIIGLLPVSQITPIQNLIADRYLLLPSAGFLLFVAALLPRKMPIYTSLSAVLVLCMWGGITLQRIPVWYSSEALWSDLTQKQPLEPRGWALLAGRYSATGRYQEAKIVLQKGLTVLPSHPQLLQGMGLVYMYEKQDTLAEEYLSKAWKNDSSLRKAANNLAIVLRRNKRITEALSISQEMVKLHPKYPKAWNTTGTLYMDVKNWPEAEDCFLQAHQLAPFDPTPLDNLGNVAYQQQDFQRAAYWWEQSLRIAPHLQHARQGLLHLQKIRSTQ